MIESLRRNPVCPLCRALIDPTSLKILNDNKKEEEKKTMEKKVLTNEEKTKAQRLIEFLMANKEAKCLLFSGYDKTFARLTPVFDEKGITYSSVSGTSARIQKIIRDFGEGKHQVLCLNARHFGAGLNIQSASHVILYHRMADELEKQIIGRAYRFGRTEDLNVIHLFHSNETGVAYNNPHASLAIHDQGNVVLQM
jgi:SNF2 family DNA or RNA helicase